jgi:hypothetical protein
VTAAVATRTRAKPECVRCLDANPATTTRTITVGDTTYRFQLCGSHDGALDDALLVWTRLAEVVEQHDERTPWAPAAWRGGVAPLRERAAPVPEPMQKPQPAEVTPIRPDIDLPAAADKWRFSVHAFERRVERDIHPDEALLAACRPTIKWIFIHGDVAVVVNPRQKMIITVLPRIERSSALSA